MGRSTVLMLTVVSACSPFANDGFRDKLAAGCKTQTECEALHDQAQTRHFACARAYSGRAYGALDHCGSEDEDESAARALMEGKRRVDTSRERADHGSVANARTGEQYLTEARSVEADKVRQRDVDCAADNGERMNAIRAAQRAAAEAKTETEHREAYVRSHCRNVAPQYYEDETVVDMAGFVRVVPVPVPRGELWKCPATTAAGVVTVSGSIVEDTVPADIKAAAGVAMVRTRALCDDLDADLQSQAGPHW